MGSRTHSVDAQLFRLALDSSEVGSSDEQEIEIECTSCRVVVCEAGGGRVSSRREVVVSGRGQGKLTRLEDHVHSQDLAVPPPNDTRLGLEQVRWRADRRASRFVSKRLGRHEGRESGCWEAAAPPKPRALVCCRSSCRSRTFATCRTISQRL